MHRLFKERKFIIGIVLGIIASSSVALMPHFIQRFVNIAFEKNTDRLQVLMYLFLICSVLIVNFMLRLLSYPLVVNSIINVTSRIRKSILSKVYRLKLEDLKEGSSGNVLSKILVDVANIEEFWVILYNEFIPSIASAIVIIFVLSTINIEMTLLFLPMFGVYFVIKEVFFKRFKQVTHNLIESRENLSSFIVDSIRNIRIIKIFLAEEYLLTKYFSKINEFSFLRKKDAELKGFYAVSVFSATELVMLSLISFLAFYSDLLNNNYGVIVAYIYSVPLVFTPFQLFFEIKSFSLCANESVASIKTVLSKEEEKIDGIMINQLNTITLNGVSFAFNENRYLFKNISMTLKKGDILCISGKSGTGKSTLLNILLKLYNLKFGEIYINGVDLNKINRSSYLAKITLVSQIPYILDGTIRENILLGESYTDESIQNALIFAGFDLRKFDNGLDYKISSIEELSGGEKQKICIARAIVRNSDLLIFDEPTSSIDNESSSIILQNILRISREKIIILSSHKEEEKMIANKIINLDS